MRPHADHSSGANRAIGGLSGAGDNRGMSSSPKVLFGFHAVGVRLKTAPQSIIEIYFEPTRRDAVSYTHLTLPTKA